MTEGRHQLRHGVRVHVSGLDRDQGTEAGRVLDDDVRHQPGINEPVVGIDENPLAPRLLTPARHVGHPLDVGLAVSIGGLRAGRKHLETHVGRAIHALAHALLAPFRLTTRSGRASGPRSRCGPNAWAVPPDLQGASVDRVKRLGGQWPWSPHWNTTAAAALQAVVARPHTTAAHPPTI